MSLRWQGPALEALEQRLLLSGTITTALDASRNLTITGDAAGNNITIEKGAGNDVTVTGNDGETFAGLGSAIDNVTGNIKIFTNAGNDTVTLGQAGGTFLVGDEANFDPNVQAKAWGFKDLAVDLGDGADVLTLVAPLCRNLDIKGGAGNSQIALRDNGLATLTDGSACVTGKLTIVVLNDGCTIDIAGAVVYKDAAITMGGGTNALTIRQDTRQEGDIAAPTFASWFGGKLAIVGGGDDTVGLAAAVTVGGDTSLKLGGGANSVTIATSLDASGGFAYEGMAGVDTLDWRRLTVRRTASIRTGDGNDVVAFYDGCALRDLAIDTAGGNDALYIGDDAARQGQGNLAEYDTTTIKGALSVKLGAGGDAAFVGYDEVSGSTVLSLGEMPSIDGGLGADGIQFGSVWFAYLLTLKGFE